MEKPINMIKKFILFLSSIIFIGCSENKKPMVKPFVERRLAYYVFDKSSEEVIGKLDSMNRKDLEFLQAGLDTAKVDSSSKYFQYYSMYNQPLDFLQDAARKIEFLQKQLEADSKKVSGGNFIETSSTYKKLFLNKKYGIFFKDEWYLNPALFFSEDFYSLFFVSDMELLMNHYQYDSDSISEFSEFHLPTSKLLSDNDPEVIQPHEINKTKASYLLKKMKPSPSDLNSVLQYEYKLFEKMLEGVIKDKYIVVLYNYSIP